MKRQHFTGGNCQGVKTKLQTLRSFKIKQIYLGKEQTNKQKWRCFSKPFHDSKLMTVRCLHPVVESLWFTFSLAHVAQVLPDGEASSATVAATEAGHFLFAPHVGGVIPGQLRAGFHDSDGQKTRQRLTGAPRTVRVALRPLPHLLVKKAMTGKPGSWESVKTFWRNRFGWQLCCREESQGHG